jgi:hypothetical protein
MKLQNTKEDYLELCELAYDVNSYLQEKNKTHYHYVIINTIMDQINPEIVLTVHVIVSKTPTYRVVFYSYSEATDWLKNIFIKIKDQK